MNKVEDIRDILEKNDYKKLKSILNEYHPVDIAEFYEDLSSTESLKLFKALDFDVAVQVLEEMDSNKKYFILTNIKPIYASKLIAEMPFDNVADFLGDLSEEDKKAILSLVGENEQVDLKDLLAYDKDSAGGRMTTEYIAFSKDLKAKDALNKLGELALDAETIYYVFAVDSEGRLVGVVSLRDLILAPEQTPIEDFMQTDVKKVNALQDQEEVARLIKKYGFLALPVVDVNNILLGIVTVDDAMMVVEEETTEDILKLSGSDFDKKIDLGQVSPWARAKRRLPWILVAVVGEIFSGRVINDFSAALQTVVALSFFIPVLMDMGGNVGTQSAAIIVRGLATGEINTSSIAKNVLREAAVGMILGVFNGLLVATITYLWQGEVLLGVVVGIAMAFNLTLAAMLGTFMPLLWHKLGHDPAVASGPLITTSLDILGLFVYFSTATWILKL
ncbi:MAG TPA: magnesium transporter [Thermoanaerobacterales bacterium]|jgi:magnesium transporter|nr:magnesium transporter [Thermoanaerobacterales bacterium]